jgi:hypothetical protein
MTRITVSARRDLGARFVREYVALIAMLSLLIGAAAMLMLLVLGR